MVVSDVVPNGSPETCLTCQLVYDLTNLLLLLLHSIPSTNAKKKRLLIEIISLGGFAINVHCQD